MRVGGVSAIGAGKGLRSRSDWAAQPRSAETRCQIAKEMKTYDDLDLLPRGRENVVGAARGVARGVALAQRRRRRACSRTIAADAWPTTPAARRGALGRAM